MESEGRATKNVWRENNYIMKLLFPQKETYKKLDSNATRMNGTLPIKFYIIWISNRENYGQSASELKY